jgi:hypothetical protein
MIRMILLLFMTLVPAAVFAQQIAPSIDVDASRSHATEERGIAAAPAQSATTVPSPRGAATAWSGTSRMPSSKAR